MMAVPNRTEQWGLRALLSGVAESPRLDDRVISALCSDSRRVAPGALFFASAREPALHIAQALAKGAAAVVMAKGAFDSSDAVPVPVIAVPDVRRAIGEVADRFFGQPSSRVKVIGITGTNGKTSVSHFIAHALQQGSVGRHRCGVFGTLGYGLYPDLDAGVLTTPDAITVHSRLAEMCNLGASHAVMEVSSHGLDQARVAGVAFDIAVFTNLSRDHLDYHPDMGAYAAAKEKLFNAPGLRVAVVNVDDTFGQRLIRRIPDSVEVFGFGTSEKFPVEAGGRVTRLAGSIVSANEHCITVSVRTPQGRGEISAPLLGAFNVSNLMAALGALLACGFDLRDATDALRDVPTVAGRMERFGGGPDSPLVVVDYSHTPDALANALAAIRAQVRGNIWCVFGCGGDRDRGKRAEMGRIAASLAERVVLTDDNPRGEDGDEIVDDILTGIADAKNVLTIRDRGAAIRYAVGHAEPGDTVLVAGKGHEPYQEVRGVRRPFSDAAAVRIALAERSA